MKKFALVLFCIFLILGGGCQHSETVITVITPPPTPSPTPLKTIQPQPTPTPTPEPAQASIAVAGDLLCLSAQLSAARNDGEYSFDQCFAMIKNKISAADLAIANLETLVAADYPYTKPSSDDANTATESIAASDTDAEAVPSPTKKPNPRINAPEAFLSALSGSGFDVLTTANNHMYDYKADGLIQTLQKLDEFEFAHTGAYMAETDKAPLIIDVNGINIAICAYTDIINRRPASSDAFMIDRYDEDLVASDIKAAREAGADYVIVCVHWGVEHTHNPNSTQRKMAAYIAQAGANIILGSHPHCTQPFESIETDHGNVPVLYSLGNFISSMGETIHKDGVLLNFTLEKDWVSGQTSLVSLSYTPTFCASTSDIGRFVIYPADAVSITHSDIAQTLSRSRERTVSILTENIATAE